MKSERGASKWIGKKDDLRGSGRQDEVWWRARESGVGSRGERWQGNWDVQDRDSVGQFSEMKEFVYFYQLIRWNEGGTMDS